MTPNAGRASSAGDARALSERESLALLAAAGIPVVAARAAADADAAVAAAAETRWPASP